MAGNIITKSLDKIQKSHPATFEVNLFENFINLISFSDMPAITFYHVTKKYPTAKERGKIEELRSKYTIYGIEFEIISYQDKDELKGRGKDFLLLVDLYDKINRMSKVQEVSYNECKG